MCVYVCVVYVCISLYVRARVRWCADEREGEELKGRDREREPGNRRTGKQQEKGKAEPREHSEN